MKLRSKFLITSLIIIIAAGVVFSKVTFIKKDLGILETSILSMVKLIAQQNLEPPDLGIENVALKKINDPTDTFNYYKYEMTMVIKNHGGNLVNGQVALRAFPDQKNVLLKNTDDGFTLYAGDSYIVRDYEVVFDANYNGGTIIFELDVVDGVDFNKANNTHFVSLFEGNAKISPIVVNDILEDGTLSLDFGSLKYSTKKHNFEVFIANAKDLGLKTDKIGYSELSREKNIFSYNVIPFSESFLEKNFVSAATTEIDAHTIRFPKDPYFENDGRYFYLRISNPDNDYFAVSDVLYFSSDDEMTRAQFAKFFVDSSGVGLFDEGKLYYTDTYEDQWYRSYVQTLYNLGLLPTDTWKLNPGEIVTRSEAIKTVMDFYDVDLAVSDGAPHFADVKYEDQFYPYAESFYLTNEMAKNIEYLNPELPVTQKYLNYLINEYSSSN